MKFYVHVCEDIGKLKSTLYVDGVVYAALISRARQTFLQRSSPGKRDYRFARERSVCTTPFAEQGSSFCCSVYQRGIPAATSYHGWVLNNREHLVPVSRIVARKSVVRVRPTLSGSFLFSHFRRYTQLFLGERVGS